MESGEVLEWNNSFSGLKACKKRVVSFIWWNLRWRWLKTMKLILWRTVANSVDDNTAAFLNVFCCHMGVSENSGTPKSSILIGFSIINHPFWGTIIFRNTHIFPHHGLRFVFSTNGPLGIFAFQSWLKKQILGTDFLFKELSQLVSY